MRSTGYSFSILSLMPGERRVFMREDAVGVIQIAEGCVRLDGFEPCTMTINEYYLLPAGESCEVCNHTHESAVLWVLFASQSLLKDLQSPGEDLWSGFLSLPRRYMDTRHRNNMIIRELMQNLVLNQSIPLYSETYCRLHAGIILVVTVRTCTAQPRGEQRAVQPRLTMTDVYSYVREHLAGDLSLDAIARALHFNKYYLSHTFREKAGIPLYQYVLHRRLEYANTLLEEGFSVREAALRSGFRDTSTFIRRYKQRWGVTPRQHALRVLNTRRDLPKG